MRESWKGGERSSLPAAAARGRAEHGEGFAPHRLLGKECACHREPILRHTAFEVKRISGTGGGPSGAPGKRAEWAAEQPTDRKERQHARRAVSEDAPRSDDRDD